MSLCIYFWLRIFIKSRSNMTALCSFLFFPRSPCLLSKRNNSMLVCLLNERVIIFSNCRNLLSGDVLVWRTFNVLTSMRFVFLSHEELASRVPLEFHRTQRMLSKYQSGKLTNKLTGMDFLTLPCDLLSPAVKNHDPITISSCHNQIFIYWTDVDRECRTIYWIDSDLSEFMRKIKLTSPRAAAYNQYERKTVLIHSFVHPSAGSSSRIGSLRRSAFFSTSMQLNLSKLSLTYSDGSPILVVHLHRARKSTEKFVKRKDYHNKYPIFWLAS